MDFRNLFSRRGDFNRLSIRIPALSKGSLKRKFTSLGSLPQWIKAIASFLISLMLAQWAYQVTAKQSLETWWKSSPPTDLTWKSTLLHSGYILVTDPKLIRRWIKDFVAFSQEDGPVWVDSNSCAVALSGQKSLGQGEVGIPLFFIKTGISDPKSCQPHWQLLGWSWPGYLKLVAWLEDPQNQTRLIDSKKGTPKDQKNGQGLTHSNIPIDPRRIVY